MSSDAVDSALKSAHHRILYDNLRPSDPNWPFPDGGAQAFWNDLMSGLEGRWKQIQDNLEAKLDSTEQTKLTPNDERAVSSPGIVSNQK
jgi:hypothetical protein